MRARTFHPRAEGAQDVGGVCTSQSKTTSQTASPTESMARHLRRQSLLDLRLKEHATRVAWQLACVRNDDASGLACEHSAILNELRERGAL